MKSKIKDPIFYLGLTLLLFWIADSFERIFILHIPATMLWWSPVGLIFTAIGLIFRNKIILTTMFCVLAVPEILWTISFFNNLVFNSDPLKIASYAFKPDYPRRSLVITLFHLFVIPSIIFGLVNIRSIYNKAWLTGFVYASSVALLAYYFPDIKQDVNCSKGTHPACIAFFGQFASLGNPLRLVVSAVYFTLLVFIPLNLLLLIVSRKIKFHSDNTGRF